MILGAVLVLAALSLFLWNQWENQQAGAVAENILSKLEDQILMMQREPDNPCDSEMTVTELDGYEYIGYLSIPSLDLELPILSEWDYSRLRIAPCRYAGSTKTDDLVICAHNYGRHFGNIKNLSIGDKVYFTDMDGLVSVYEVVEIGTLAPTAVEDMKSGGYDLTLFTCTYGGQSRVTVRCDEVMDAEGFRR